MPSCAAPQGARHIGRTDVRREGRRSPSALPVLIHVTGRDHSARLRNLSEGGAMIEADVRLFRGDEVDLKCGSIDVVARVVWHSGTNIGLQFRKPISEKDLKDQVHRADFLADRRKARRSAADALAAAVAN